MDRQTTRALARSLGIAERMIRTYRRQWDGSYDVVLDDYRKLNGVRPSKGELPVGAAGRQVQIPVHLQLVYARPRRHARRDLLELAALLGLSGLSKANKPRIVAAIEARKKALQEGS
jgi:hypothetical protein